MMLGVGMVVPESGNATLGRGTAVPKLWKGAAELGEGRRSSGRGGGAQEGDGQSWGIGRRGRREPTGGEGVRWPTAVRAAGDPVTFSGALERLGSEKKRKEEKRKKRKRKIQC
jgi:hypothetical protein